ncbi:alpha/beta hydrolase-fold protein [Verrucomicrobiales bacterium]|nr:alpha/beta hydrolase-fold protein [Verrucomicrobiales bacterium]
MKISLHRHSFKASVFVSLWLIGVIFVNLLSIADSEGKGGVEKRSYYFKEADKEIDYRLYVPSGYSKGKKFPLIVLLHGLGSNPQQVIRYQGIIQEAEKRNYIVVAPYGYNERGWYGARGKGKQGTIEALLLGENDKDPENIGELSERDVMNVLDIIRKEFSVDDERIYLMGHSMGGGGAIYLGEKYSSIWAGLAPLAPAAMPPAVSFDSSILKKMTKTPIYLVAGERDRIIPVFIVREWAQEMKRLKMDYIYEEIEGGDHSGSFANNPKMIARIYNFFDKRRKGLRSNNKVSPLRVFTNRTGVKIKASVDSVSAGKVTIVRADNKKFTIPISSLSDEDEKYLKEWLDNQ